MPYPCRYTNRIVRQNKRHEEYAAGNGAVLDGRPVRVIYEGKHEYCGL